MEDTAFKGAVKVGLAPAPTTRFRFGILSERMTKFERG